MGLSSVELEYLIRLRESGYFSNKNSVVEIGAQQLSGELIHNTDLLSRVSAAFGVTLPSFDKPVGRSFLPGGTEELREDAPSARPLWKALGFDYASIDVDGSPGAIPLDLNTDSCPHDRIKRYNLVVNSGTTEHIANQLNAFKVIHDLCAINGVMIHNVPVAGMYTHGLFSYTPKFFWMLCRSNCYRFMHFDLNMGETEYPMISDVADGVGAFSADAGARVSKYLVRDGLIFVAVQKLYDMDYISPLDVPTGASANHVLSERYWTVFQNDKLQEYIKSQHSSANSDTNQ